MKMICQYVWDVSSHWQTVRMSASINICNEMLIKINNVSIVYRCSNCDFPLCSTKCIGINQIMGHSDFECKSLKDHQVHKFLDTKDIKDLQEVYECILILR